MCIWATANSGSTATKCTAKIKRAFGPLGVPGNDAGPPQQMNYAQQRLLSLLGVPKCEAQKQCSKSSSSNMSAVAGFGAQTSSANASIQVVVDKGTG